MNELYEYTEAKHFRQVYEDFLRVHGNIEKYCRKQGFYPVEFRPPNKGEKFLDPSGVIIEAINDFYMSNPLVILKKEKSIAEKIEKALALSAGNPLENYTKKEIENYFAANPEMVPVRYGIPGQDKYIQIQKGFGITPNRLIVAEKDTITYWYYTT
jgi:hypothetical protein